MAKKLPFFCQIAVAIYDMPRTVYPRDGIQLQKKLSKRRKGGLELDRLRKKLKLKINEIRFYSGVRMDTTV
jgi:hypothetical protein